jgi:chorismate lyase
LQAQFPVRDWCAVSSLSTIAWLSLQAGTIPPRVLDWLAVRGSLTQRLRAESGALSVVCLQQGILAADPELWQRQVLLLKAGRPWIWGLTQVPRSTLVCYPELNVQGEQPLGDWLFGVAGARRDELMWADLAAEPALAVALKAWQLPHPAALWGRHSRLHLPRGECAITEVFLPDAPLYAGIVNEE